MLDYILGYRTVPKSVVNDPFILELDTDSFKDTFIRISSMQNCKIHDNVVSSWRGIIQAKVTDFLHDYPVFSMKCYCEALWAKRIKSKS